MDAPPTLVVAEMADRGRNKVPSCHKSDKSIPDLQIDGISGELSGH